MMTIVMKQRTSGRRSHNDDSVERFDEVLVTLKNEFCIDVTHLASIAMLVRYCRNPLTPTLL
jgi:hypothetical protein